VFNRLKPDYQFPRDREVNERYTEQGYYVVRIFVFRVVKDNTQLSFVPISPLEVYNLTIDAVRDVIEERKALYAKGDFGGKVVLFSLPCDGCSTYNNTETNRYALERYGTRVINARAKTFAPTDELGRAKLRGTILEQELAMRDAESMLYRQEQQQSVRSEIGLPKTQDAGVSITEFLSKTLNIGTNSTTTTSKYEQHWRTILDSYDPEENYNERVSRIDQDLIRLQSTQSSVNDTPVRRRPLLSVVAM